MNPTGDMTIRHRNSTLLCVAMVLAGAMSSSAQPPVRGVYVEFGIVRFEIPEDRVVGSHFVTTGHETSVREFDYFLEAAPGDTAITLDFPSDDIAVGGTELSLAAGGELIKRSMMIVNQPRVRGETATWTRPDRLLEARVLALTYNTYSDPPRERATASVIVVWKIRDAGSHVLLYETSTPGGDTMDGRGEECIRRAFVDALMRLLDDREFLSIVSPK